MADANNHEEGSASGMPPAIDGMTHPPWELIENGRYMPRRIRGSFPGRELG